MLNLHHLALKAVNLYDTQNKSHKGARLPPLTACSELITETMYLKITVIIGKLQSM